MIALALLLATSATPQEPAPAPEPDGGFVRPDAPDGAAGQEPGVNEEILAAIAKVIRSYDDADRNVRQAAESAAVQRTERLAAAESAVGSLVADMEALLKLLPKPESSSSSSSSSSDPSQGDGSDPNDPQRQGEREPGRGDRPDDSQAGGLEEQLRGQTPPPVGPPLEGQALPGYARWGLLPPRLQEALRNAGTGDVPLRYRRWIEEYHRRGAQPR